MSGFVNILVSFHNLVSSSLQLPSFHNIKPSFICNLGFSLSHLDLRYTQTSGFVEMTFIFQSLKLQLRSKHSTVEPIKPLERVLRYWSWKSKSVVTLFFFTIFEESWSSLREKLSANMSTVYMFLTSPVGKKQMKFRRFPNHSFMNQGCEPTLLMPKGMHNDSRKTQKPVLSHSHAHTVPSYVSVQILLTCTYKFHPWKCLYRSSIKDKAAACSHMYHYKKGIISQQSTHYDTPIPHSVTWWLVKTCLSWKTSWTCVDNWSLGLVQT